MQISTGMSRIYCVIALVAPIAAHARAQSTAPANSARDHRAALAGRVRDGLGHPLVAAVVQANDQGTATIVDDSGIFRIAGLLPGVSRFTATRAGYEPATFVIHLPSDSTVFLDIHLEPIGPATVATMSDSYTDVRLDVTGFGDRRRDMIGYFIEPDRIARKPMSHVAEYLIGIPGVLVQSRPKGAGYDVTFARGRGCEPTVFVDGVLSHAAVDDAVPAADLFALEVYLTPSTVPDRFSSEDREHGCGVVAVWTRKYAP
jgi:carboxypeptidase family protein